MLIMTTAFPYFLIEPATALNLFDSLLKSHININIIFVNTSNKCRYGKMHRQYVYKMCKMYILSTALVCLFYVFYPINTSGHNWSWERALYLNLVL